MKIVLDEPTVLCLSADLLQWFEDPRTGVVRVSVSEITIANGCIDLLTRTNGGVCPGCGEPRASGVWFCAECDRKLQQATDLVCGPPIACETVEVED